MKSQIKIDFRHGNPGEGLHPVLAIRMENSEDVKDSLLKSFFEMLGHDSSWLRVCFDHYLESGNGKETITYVTITPVRPSQLRDTMDEIDSRILNTGGENFNYTPLFKFNGGPVNMVDYGPVSRRCKQVVSYTDELKKKLTIPATAAVQVNESGYDSKYYVETVSLCIGIGKDHTADLIMSKEAWEALKSGEEINIENKKEFDSKY